MSDGALRDLACAAGLQVEWTDTSGHLREVSLATLQTVLQALGYSVCNRTDILESQRRLDEQAHVLPFLLTVRESESVCVGHVSRARLRTQDGEWRELKLRPLKVGGSCARAPAIAGYYQLELDDDRHVLAVVPARCFSISEIFAGRRLAA